MSKLNFPDFLSRAAPNSVALETTLLVHGVPRGQGRPLADELDAICREHRALPAFVGLHRGRPTVGLSAAELDDLLAAPHVPKSNTANLGVFIHRAQHAATTVATTMELAAAAGVRVFATGGLGGVHRGYGERLDISADLAAFTRFPVAVVASGVKSLLDVASTRELLESLGIPVVGFRTDRFPAFYIRDGGIDVDARFDDIPDLARFIRQELARSGRGVVVCNPIPAESEVSASEWSHWLAEADRRASDRGISGRDVTPFILGALHEISAGRTLRANLDLARANTRVAALLADSLASS